MAADQNAPVQIRSTTAQRATAKLAELVRLRGGSDRQQQIDLTAELADAIAADGRITAQAATGTGKSFAYLVAVLESGKRALLVPGSIALQDQLAEDIEAVRGLFPPFTSVVRKGMSNYACMLACEEALEDIRPRKARNGATELDSEVDAVARWGYKSPTGDRADLPGPVSDEAWDKVSIGSSECVGRDACPFADDCHILKLRERSKVADLVVVNPHLFAIDAMLSGVVLASGETEPFAVIVIDEAHFLPDVAQSIAGSDIGAGRLRWVASKVTKAGSNSSNLKALADRLETELAKTQQTARPRSIRYSSGQDLDAAIDFTLSDLRTEAVVLGNDLRNLIESAGGRKKADPTLIRALGAVTKLTVDLQSLFSDGSDGQSTMIHWTDAEAIHVNPREVDGLLAPAWAGRAVIAVSATLPSDIVRRLGLDLDVEWTIDAEDRAVAAAVRSDVTVPRHEYDSPFDFSKSLLYIPSHLPSPADGSGPTKGDAWRVAAAAEAIDLCRASDGGALILCTSTAMVHVFADALTLAGFDVLAQRDGATKNQLVAALKEDGRRVIVGTKGMWQGVDVQGLNLRLVVIDRIPFVTPDNILVNARIEALNDPTNHCAGLYKVTLPLAITDMQQAAGRLIRSTDCRGVVAVLDSRMLTARYGAVIQRALPAFPMTSDPIRAMAALRQTATDFSAAA